MDMQAEIEKVRLLLPSEPPSDAHRVIIERGGLNRDLLIYSTEWVNDGGEKKRMVKLRCTACGGTVYAEKTLVSAGCWRSGAKSEYGFVHPITGEIHHSHENTLCPNCRCGVDVRHVSYVGHEHCIQCVDVMEVRNVAGYITLIAWELSKDCNKDAIVTYRAHAIEAAALIGKRFVRYSVFGRFFTGTYYMDHWETRKRFDDMFDEVNRAVVLPFDSEVVWSSNAATSALEEYLSTTGTGTRFPVRYLQLWSKYPTVENLIRNGARPLVDNCIENARGWSSYGRKRTFDPNSIKIFDFKKARPHEILGVQKEEYPRARNMGVNEFRMYKLARARGVTNIDAVMRMAKKRGLKIAADFFEEHAFAPVEKTFLYLERQDDSCCTKHLVSFAYLRDYWNLVVKAQGEIADNQRYPKNLEREHDRFMARVKEKGDVRLSEKIQRRAAELKRWVFADDEIGLMIRPAASHEELIVEGKVLNHCVAGYAEDHANQKTTIFFIRSIGAPDIPFYTLEFKDGKVAQNRGKRNCERTTEVIEFEKRWLQYLKEEVKYVG